MFLTEFFTKAQLVGVSVVVIIAILFFLYSLIKRDSERIKPVALDRWGTLYKQRGKIIAFKSFSTDLLSLEIGKIIPIPHGFDSFCGVENWTIFRIEENPNPQEAEDILIVHIRHGGETYPNSRKVSIGELSRWADKCA